MRTGFKGCLTPVAPGHGRVSLCKVRVKWRGRGSERGAGWEGHKGQPKMIVRCSAIQNWISRMSTAV